MHLEIIIQSKVKSERDRQMSYDITYMWNVKYKTNELSTKQKKIQRYREQTCSLPRERGGGEGMDQEFGISRCILYTGWINKVILYSTGNHIQYPVINHNEKEYIYV